MLAFTRLLTAVAAAGALLMSIYNTTQIKEVHVMMNSRLSELLDLTRASSKAEGVKEERDRLK